MIRGLIFDCDGLLIDSEATDYQAWQELFASHKCDLPLDTWKHNIGRGAGDFDVYALLENQFGRPIDRAALRARHRQRNVELLGARPTVAGRERLYCRSKAPWIEAGRRVELVARLGG